MVSQLLQFVFVVCLRRYLGPNTQGEKEAAAARANHPIPPACGIYYYEVTILDKGYKGYVPTIPGTI